MRGTGRPLVKTFFLHCQKRDPELPKIPTYLHYFNHSFSINPYQSQSQTQPGSGPSWAYSPYLPLESVASEGADEKQAKQVCMHACVCANQSILPLIFVQSSNLALYSMFVLQHGEPSETRDKQCACCIRSNKNL